MSISVVEFKKLRRLSSVGSIGREEYGKLVEYRIFRYRIFRHRTF